MWLLLIQAKDKIGSDINAIRGQHERANVIEHSIEEEEGKLNAVDGNITEQLSELMDINSTISMVQVDLNLANQTLVNVRNELTSLMNKLQGLTNPNITTANDNVKTAETIVTNNGHLLNDVESKIKILSDTSIKLEEKYKELKQHRDLLQQILSNIGDSPCIKASK